MLCDVLEVLDQSDLVVYARERVRGDSVLQEGDVNVQERERKNRVRERDFRNEILENAGTAWDKGDKRKVKRFFAVRGVLLRDGVLDAEDHRREDVDEVQTDKERQQAPELQGRRMAIVCESVNANADANENADDARGRKQREQVLVRVDALADSEEDEREPQLGEQERGAQA